MRNISIHDSHRATRDAWDAAQNTVSACISIFMNKIMHTYVIAMQPNVFILIHHYNI